KVGGQSLLSKWNMDFCEVNAHRQDIYLGRSLPWHKLLIGLAFPVINQLGTGQPSSTISTAWALNSAV
ncbi:MAG TPA: hypothetical protein VK961_07015, partial [Chthoniobacter sp.]|nr:hypothetical protein [Chthoniobacter sp.]